MPIKIDKTALSSRLVRKSIRDALGDRTVDLLQDSIDIYTDTGITTKQKIWRITKRVTGTLCKWFIGDWSFRDALQSIYNTVKQLMAFDWNQTDEELNSLIESNNLAMYSITGGFAGSTAGWIASIGVGNSLSQAIPFIGGSMLRAMVLQDVVPEAIEQTISNYKAWFKNMMELSLKNDLIWAYRNIRSLIKKAGALLEDILGENVLSNLLEQWGHPEGRVASINEGIEWLIEKIPHQGLQNAAEEFLEEFEASFMEGGFIVASTFDTAWQLMLAGQWQREDSIRQVAVYPDEDNEDEKLLVIGEQSSIIPAVTNALATFDIVDGSDVGEILGEPLKDFYRKNPLRRRLTIQFREKKNRPFRMEDGSQARVWSYNIPEPKLGLNWQKVKLASKQYTWGPYRASALMSNGGKMVIWGGSETQARDKLEELATLSEADIQKISVSRDVKFNPALTKDPVTAYPYKATLLFRKENYDGEGITDLDGKNWVSEMQSMYLWHDEEPDKVINFTGEA